MKILKFLIILIFILFPFGELLRFNIGNNIVLKPLDIAVMIVSAYYFIRKIIQRKNINFIPWYFLPFPLIGLISLGINSFWLKPHELFVSVLYLLRWIAFASIFLIILEFDQKFKSKIKKLLFIEGIVIVFFGFMQYFFFNSLKDFYHLGWDEHMNRIFSVFLDPNYAGAFFVLFLLYTINLIYKKDYTPITKKYYYLILAITLSATFMTFSRSALFMLIVGSIIYFNFLRKRRFILVILGCILLFIVLVSPKFYDENMNLFRINSSSARLGNYSSALIVIRDHPIIGVGFNSYRYTKELYGFDYNWVSAPSHADSGVDNSILFIMATTGILGLISYFLLWYQLLKKSEFIVISSFFALLINSQFINSLFFAPLMFWMWAISACYFSHNTKKLE